MKVRIGIAPGAGRNENPENLEEIAGRLDEIGIDSLWLSEIVSSPAPDPMVGLAYAAARTRRLKLGTGVSVLPGRNPVLFAKQLATLARLAPGRILPAVGLGPARAADRDAFPLPSPVPPSPAPAPAQERGPGGPGQRGAVFDEALVLLRRLLTEPSVTFHGRYFTLDDVGIGTLPAKPLDIWLGGAAPAALRRVGRLGDGWLASLITPSDAARGIAAVAAAADAAERTVDPEHYGLSIPVALGDGIPPELAATLRRRRPDADPAALVPEGWDALRRRIRDYVAVGMSKFVVRPVTSPPSWSDFIDQFATELLPLET
ncbi:MULTISPECIES: TIGR03854 family LLM class F420-dependent oxidoreductase [Protofrankia]|uniref:Putative F420-dependent oxidoreductase, MSMEG_3544 family n=1 Tax=Candidatus Protofrankia datiscae TaxID=2716812 RepID=F8B3N6_9ACTN|nr:MULTISPECIES: TIGR03854 family LLM class F420-dependent oxidoreductase [Protofrankia]AEH07876.1 putative F420-dependent oxidoreductase, MSMEG_3544 family [Candidatus Protofrankia datiscae]